MRLAPSRIAAFLQRPDPEIRAVLLYGPDEGLARERAEAVARSVCPDLKDPFRVADPHLTRDEQVTIAIQVNGKLRGTLEIPRDADNLAVEEAAMALPQVLRWLEGRPPRKVIVVPNRIVNIVA